VWAVGDDEIGLIKTLHMTIHLIDVFLDLPYRSNHIPDPLSKVSLWLVSGIPLWLAIYARVSIGCLIEVI